MRTSRSCILAKGFIYPDCQLDTETANEEKYSLLTSCNAILFEKVISSLECSSTSTIEPSQDYLYNLDYRSGNILMYGVDIYNQKKGVKTLIKVANVSKISGYHLVFCCR